jgi:drug/metabolite transporter (DMT)-like permease
MKRSVWITFGLLCLLSSTAWVAEPFGLSALPSLQRQGLLYGVIGLVALTMSGKKLWSRAGQTRRWAQLAAAGLMFFGIPAAAIEFASGSVPDISRSALFAMVPIVVAVAVAASDATSAAEKGARRSLAPALVGLGGLLLLLPLNFSNSPRGNAMLALVSVAVVLVGTGSIWLFRLLQGVELAEAVTLVCLPNATFLLAAGIVAGDAVWSHSSLASLVSLSSLVDLLEVLLLLWLTREMPPIRFAARFLVIPLLTVLEGYIVLHPPLTLRIAAGAVLLALGAARLLLMKPAEDDVVLSLR